MSNITTTNAQEVFKLIAAADESAEISQIRNVLSIEDGTVSVSVNTDSTFSSLFISGNEGLLSINILDNNTFESTEIKLTPTKINVLGLQTFTNDAEAGQNGLTTGDLYKHTTGGRTSICIKD